MLKIRTALLVTALVSVPLIVGGRAIGVLSVYSRQAGRQFREHDVHLLSTLADFSAIAIRNADLYHDVRRTADRFAALAEINRRISESLDRHTVLERIAAYAKELLLADDSEVYLLDQASQTLKAIVAVGDYAEEIKAQTLRAGRGGSGGGRAEWSGRNGQRGRSRSASHQYSGHAGGARGPVVRAVDFSRASCWA